MSSAARLKISFQEIRSATNSFAEANIIGRGGYGRVYRGQSKKHGMLAIKRLERSSSGQGDHEFGTEVSLLSRYRHENLVSLIGFCAESGERILVYKYEVNGSLDKLLQRKDLSWKRRLEICLGAAQGVRYLHDKTGSEHGVIHRDIKSSNILLDENWKAKISDFGLSKLALTSSADSVVYTGARGTRGYVDPKYMKYDTLTKKSDIYSFGIVLLEVLFGKLITETSRAVNGNYFTIEMAQKHYTENTLDTMIDVDLRNEMDSASLTTFSVISFECLEYKRKNRPTMNSVVEALERALGCQQVSNRKNSFELSSNEFLQDVYITLNAHAHAQAARELIWGWLHEALEKEGLSTYNGNSSKGVVNEPLYPSAIKQSRSFIIVFSNDAPNPSYLDEVVEIVKWVKERDNVLVPIFCNVDPRDVRDLKSAYTLWKYYPSHPRIGVWRKALAEAATLPGLHRSHFGPFQDLAKEAAAIIKAHLSEKAERITEVSPTK